MNETVKFGIVDFTSDPLQCIYVKLYMYLLYIIMNVLSFKWELLPFKFLKCDQSVISWDHFYGK